PSSPDRAAGRRSHPLIGGPARRAAAGTRQACRVSVPRRSSIGLLLLERLLVRRGGLMRESLPICAVRHTPEAKAVRMPTPGTTGPGLGARGAAAAEELSRSARSSGTHDPAVRAPSGRPRVVTVWRRPEWTLSVSF